MARYNQSPNVGNATRFAKSPMAEVEFSRMVATPTWLVPFNAGDIVPVYYSEILPHTTMSLDVNFVIREMTKLRPVMGEMQVDLFAFFVPNRIVNESWKNVQGENTSGFWSAPEVELAPLYKVSRGITQNVTEVQVPVGSVADYYGFPTQDAIPTVILEQCNDIKIRDYLAVYNEYFRDQNYQAPIPFSTLNVYNGFFELNGNTIALDGSIQGADDYRATYEIDPDAVADGSFPDGAVVKAIAGQGGSFVLDGVGSSVIGRLTTFSALDKPLKANKLHDYFTSALPSPQKGAEVYFGIGDVANVSFDTSDIVTAFSSGRSLLFRLSNDVLAGSSVKAEFANLGGTNNSLVTLAGQLATEDTFTNNYDNIFGVRGSNLVGYADLSQATGISVNDLRLAVATQQVYETLARGGSRYTSMLRNFFELETESPFMDIPLQLGHIRRSLDMFQVAQTSATDNESPQGNLSAYGYTNDGGHLFTRTFIEHGYVHVFAIVRQKNIYTSYMAQDNFRRSTLDFYLPQFANIGEQPLRLALLNPFRQDSLERAIGYQEAWAEYRYEPDRCTGVFRSGVDGSLDVWTYADDFDSSFTNVDGQWLKSNAEEVLNRTIAVTSDIAPQFKGQFVYRVDKQLPMPTYSIPGLDTI